MNEELTSFGANGPEHY